MRLLSSCLFGIMIVFAMINCIASSSVQNKTLHFTIFGKPYKVSGFAMSTQPETTIFTIPTATLRQWHLDNLGSQAAKAFTTYADEGKIPSWLKKYYKNFIYKNVEYKECISRINSKSYKLTCKNKNVVKLN